MSFVGVDVGGTKILAIEIDGNGADTGRRNRVATPIGATAVIDAIVDVVASFSSVDAVGVGLPGLVDRTGRLRAGSHLPGIVDTPFAAELTARLGVPVVADNDATCATLAELELGAARGTTDAVLVTLGTGIGGGVVAGGRLQRGAYGFAGEPGHMVVDPNGPACPCGRRGCWERYASGSGLGRMGREAAEAGRSARLVELAGGDPEAVRGEHVTRAAAEGDPGALAVCHDFGWWVALGVANLIDLLDPEVVVVGGGLVDAGDLLLEPARAALAGLVLSYDRRPDVAIVAAALGADAGAIGAALSARAAASAPG